MYLLLDVFVVGAILSFSLIGVRKGLVLSLANLITFVCALWGAQFAASSFSKDMEPVVKPLVSSMVDKAVENMMTDILSELSSSLSVEAYSAEVLDSLGLSSKAVESVTNGIIEQIDRAGDGVKEYLTIMLTKSITDKLTYVLAFLAIILALSIAARFLDTVVTLPGQSLINNLGGGVCGFGLGVLIVYACGLVIIMLGFGQNTETHTFLMKYFI